MSFYSAKRTALSILSSRRYAIVDLHGAIFDFLPKKLQDSTVSDSGRWIDNVHENKLIFRIRENCNPLESDLPCKVHLNEPI